ncbi:MAG: hypothetical protein LW625_05305 [Planctomycetaceae bacterium]|nr:hypothetical protein [Planctomycetaceae bacterium]
MQDLLTMASDVAVPSLFAGGVAITATVLVERLGGSVGGIISTVPTTIVPAAIGIWWRRTNPDDFINAMAFVPIGTLMNAAYLVLWRVVPARVGRHVQGRSHMLAATLTVALGAWLAVAAVVMLLQRSFHPTPMHALAAGGLACLAGLVLGVFANRAAHPAPRGRHPVRWPVLALRGVAAALAIGFALVLARMGLPVASGLASVFPVIFTTVMVATWIAQGPSVPTGAVGPMILGSTSVGTFAMLAVAMFPLMSIALAAPLCWLMAVLLINVPAFLFLERRRRRAALHAS